MFILNYGTKIKRIFDIAKHYLFFFQKTFFLPYTSIITSIITSFITSINNTSNTGPNIHKTLIKTKRI